MLLTRRAAYSLLVVLHLAEHAGEGSVSAHDLAEFYGWPHEGLAKILQRLTAAGLLLSHHGIRGGYTLAGDPRNISVFDVIKASEGKRTTGLQGARQRHVESVPCYNPLRTVDHIIEDMLREFTIEELEAQASKASGEGGARLKETLHQEPDQPMWDLQTADYPLDACAAPVHVSACQPTVISSIRLEKLTSLC